MLDQGALECKEIEDRKTRMREISLHQKKRKKGLADEERRKVQEEKEDEAQND